MHCGVKPASLILMQKPILLAIDDDTSVLEAVVQDLRRNYGQTYRILRAASGGAALDICRQLTERKETVALFLSDQRMPGMTGVEMADSARKAAPELPILMVTGYADAHAIEKLVSMDSILRKPFKVADLAGAVRKAIEASPAFHE